MSRKLLVTIIKQNGSCRIPVRIECAATCPLWVYCDYAFMGKNRWAAEIVKNRMKLTESKRVFVERWGKYDYVEEFI